MVARLVPAGVTAILALLASPVAAQDLIDGSDPEAIAAALRGFGSAEVQTDSTGDPMIVGRIDGTRYGVMFYSCSNGSGCDNIQFVSSWENPGSVSMDAINTWNIEKRYGKAYIDSENDPVLDMIVNLDGGVSRANLEDTIDYWTLALRQFRDEVLK